MIDLKQYNNLSEAEFHEFVIAYDVVKSLLANNPSDNGLRSTMYAIASVISDNVTNDPQICKRAQ